MHIEWVKINYIKWVLKYPREMNRPMKCNKKPDFLGTNRQNYLLHEVQRKKNGGVEEIGEGGRDDFYSQ
jgi:hypothetical protein